VSLSLKLVYDDGCSWLQLTIYFVRRKSESELKFEGELSPPRALHYTLLYFTLHHTTTIYVWMVVHDIDDNGNAIGHEIK
jgi:hypothetical protein